MGEEVGGEDGAEGRKMFGDLVPTGRNGGQNEKIVKKLLSVLPPTQAPAISGVTVVHSLLHSV